MKKLVINSCLVLSCISFLTGCSIVNSSPVSIEQNHLDNDDMKIFNDKKSNFKIDIKEGDTLKQVVDFYNKNNPHKHMVMNKVRNDLKFEYDYTISSLSDLVDYVKATKKTTLVITKFTGTLIELTEQDRISDIFEETYLIDIKSLDFVDQPVSWEGTMNHQEILAFIETNFNIPIIFKKQRPSAATETSESSETQTSGSGVSTNSLTEKNINDYSGTLKKLIQRIAIENRLFIKYQQGMVVLNDFDTKTFDLKIPYLDLATEELFKDITSLQIKPYDDIETQLKETLSETAKININKSNGNITIRGDYDDLRESQIIIKNFHDMYSRSISLDVYIYEVNLNKTNKFGVSLENQFVSKYLNASDVSNINLNLGQMSSVTTPGLSTLSFARTFDTAQGEDAKFNKFFLNFLNQFGNTRVLTKPKLQTINGIPVSMKITTKQDYVANIDETLSSDINTNTTNTTNSTNVEKDTIETGFTLGLYPVAQKDGKIKLIVKPLISQLMKIEPYEYGTEEAPKTIQLLTVTEKDFSQIININDGEVAVISGYIYEKDNKTKDTLPFFDSENDTPFDFFTGTKGSSVEKVEMVIAVKATILK